MTDHEMRITQERESESGYWQYAEREIFFQMEQTGFFVKNIAHERLLRIIPGHVHGENCYEIHYIDSGQGWIRTEKETYQAGPGTLFVMGPGQMHAQLSKQSDPMTEYCIYVQPEHLLSEQPEHSVTGQFVHTACWIGQDTQQTGRLMKELFHELKEKKPGYTSCAEGLLQQLIVKIVRNYRRNEIETSSRENAEKFEMQRYQRISAGNSRHFLVEKAFLYDFASLTLEDLAARIGLSIRQTQRFLSENYNENFQEMRLRARMSAAEMLLSYTGDRIATIAEKTGYASSEHFAAAFKQYYGVSPRDYRKKLPASEKNSFGSF